MVAKRISISTLFAAVCKSAFSPGAGLHSNASRRALKVALEHGFFPLTLCQAAVPEPTRGLPESTRVNVAIICKGLTI
jgi:hypothetical protein